MQIFDCTSRVFLNGLQIPGANAENHHHHCLTPTTKDIREWGLLLTNFNSTQTYNYDYKSGNLILIISDLVNNNDDNSNDTQNSTKFPVSV